MKSSATIQNEHMLYPSCEGHVSTAKCLRCRVADIPNLLNVNPRDGHLQNNSLLLKHSPNAAESVALSIKVNGNDSV